MKVSFTYEVSEQEMAMRFDLIERVIRICEPMANAAVQKQVKRIESADPNVEAEMRGRMYGIAEKLLGTAVKAATSKAKAETTVEE